MNILTGDLVDDFPYNDYPKYGSQQPKDWEIYRNITSGIDKDVWFEIAGNHDEFGVFSFDSDGHNFRKSIKTNLSDISQFHLQERIVPTNGGYNIHIIGVNPFVYPSAHPPFVYWPRPSRETMDKLEEIIEKVPEGDEVIVMDHYPLKLFPPHKRTSSGKNFQELMTTGKVHYFLSGHLHPAKPKLMHFPNLLEVVAVDSKSHNYIGCFTYDNHRFVYHQVNITRPPYAYVTNPVPTSQLTNHQIFNEVGTPVRVLSMHSKMPKITVSGDLNGEMTCKKLNSGHFLCELENNLKQGQYSISLNGSITKTVNFTIGEKSDWYLEAEYKDVNNERYIFQTILLFIVILFFIFPLPKSKFAEEFLDILNGVQTEISTTKLIIIILFGWILSIRFRIQKLSFWIKGLLLVALLWPLVLPAIFLEIEGHKGFIWMWGYECGGKFYYAI
ncbi:hypothetical protein TVAG_098890 [Trichomonas vaginalis G3]|uniref:Calcineurin-like phosphoesterase domain-containing protein n=1 Tax=Trichomonas vaginalis (strain ATCC PRA-98 / G3) TaxID=412133 RepID=A2EME0_TRIV3|nr:calcineurin-like phosphoesterase family [Trichomonas vaginalis G3]EAY06178.1 hypothetical protein TVAG_098890 [Trichomonas vaginalis G3]KAI5544327.1 calcineurin-like phosphoesterase family [Trichomonas vaginalis G3]|eukprot:XP_001318401.1 hypothetical protein [Trichomonas vaginalis G3]